MLQGVPRTIWLDKSGKQVKQWPVVEIESLRSRKPIHIVKETIQPGKVIGVGANKLSAAQVVYLSFYVNRALFFGDWDYIWICSL